MSEFNSNHDDFDAHPPWAAITLWCVAFGFIVFVLLAMFYSAYKTWGPKYEDVRHETFEHSTAFIHGKQQYLTRLHGEWMQANETHRIAICAVARYEASVLDKKDIPQNIQTWECVK